MPRQPDDHFEPFWLVGRNFWILMELSLEQLTEQLKLHRTNVKDMKLKSVMGEVLEKELEAMKAIQERLKLFTKPEEEAKSRRAAVKTPKVFTAFD